MKVKNYLPRIYDALLSDMLQRSGAVLVAGPKWWQNSHFIASHQ